MKLEEGFIICEEETKNRILKEEKGLRNYIFLSYQGLIDKFYGACKKKALFSLMEKYSLSYDLAKEYMKYMPYILDKDYNDEKLDSLAEAKRYLIKENLFSKDEFFFLRLTQYPITFLEEREDTLFLKLIEELKKYTRVNIIHEEKEEVNPTIYEYQSLEEECIDVCNQMKLLHQKGIPYERMYLLNLSKDYEFLFERLSRSYNIPIHTGLKKNILHTKFAKTFLSNLETMETFPEVIESLEESEFLKQLIALIREYDLEDKAPKDYIEFFKRELKEFSYPMDLYKDMVHLGTIDSIPIDAYSFYLGLNQGIAPKIYKDIEYLSDDLLQALSLPRSIDKNKMERGRLIHFIKTTKNLHISYPIKKGVSDLYPSGIIDEFGFKVEEKSPLYGYSEAEDLLRLKALLSIYDKTHEASFALDYYDTKSIAYKSYDNKFKGIDKTHMQERFSEDGSLAFSYSTMKYYFECPFHYYAEKILDLASYEDSTATRLGSYSHAVLEDSYKEDFDFDKSTEKNLKDGLDGLDQTILQKDKFYFSQMNEILKELIKYNHSHEEKSKLNTIECEAHISYVEGNLKFHGYIDKLLYTEIYGEIYVAIVDYKTGKDYITLDNVYDGFHLQLPSYMYLLSKYEKFKGKRIHIVGIYLQKVNMIALDNSSDIEAQRLKSFRLLGFSILDKSILPLLDPNYNNSDYIQSMSTLKDGSFNRYAKVLKEKDFTDLIELVDIFIHKAKDGVMEAKFEIAPKKIKKYDQSCTFCKYKDICFREYKDYVYLEEKKFEEREEKGYGLDKGAAGGNL